LTAALLDHEDELTALSSSLEEGQQPSMPLSEVEIAWLMAARAGDPDAFDALQQRFEGQIRAFVWRLVGDGEVEDVVQDVFLALYKNLHKIDPPEKLRPFLYRVARNRCYDELRQVGRYEVESLDDSAEWVSFQADTTQRPEDAAHWLLLHLEVQQAMLRLPELQRQALILYADQGLSYAEIAEVMDTSIGTVKSRIYYAKKGLRQLLRPQVLAVLDAEFDQQPEQNV
jgi:RNA polymerase sigma-70 factor, ECF subfamily